MKTGLTISTIGHAAVLLWGLVSFAPRELNATPPESMPIDIISETEFSQMRAGAPHAAKAETPKPIVEKVAEAKPVENVTAKVVEKPEIVTASAQVPPPAPEPKIPEPKPVPPTPPEAKAEPKRREAEKKEPDPKPEPKPDRKPETKSEFKPDEIAEVLKKDEAKRPEPKKVEAKKPEPAPKKPDPPKPQPKFDAMKIAALLDKRDPQRQAATGETVNRTMALGTATGTAPQLSQSELDALRARLRECWNPPAGAADADKLKVPILIRFKPDGTLATPPEAESVPTGTVGQAMVESAIRAVGRCQPYTMLSPAKYDTWKEIVVDFSLDGMFGG